MFYTDVHGRSPVLNYDLIPGLDTATEICRARVAGSQRATTMPREIDILDHPTEALLLQYLTIR